MFVREPQYKHALANLEDSIILLRGEIPYMYLLTTIYNKLHFGGTARVIIRNGDIHDKLTPCVWRVIRSRYFPCQMCFTRGIYLDLHTTSNILSNLVYLLHNPPRWIHCSIIWNACFRSRRWSSNRLPFKRPHPPCIMHRTQAPHLCCCSCCSCCCCCCCW